MTISFYFQQAQDGKSTLSELNRLYNSIPTDRLFCLFAYATMSGLHAFQMNFGDNFWNETPTRWLFGLDYGRTQPAALRAIMAKPNTEVRIHDGEWVCQREGYVPRRDFHVKSAFFLTESETHFGVISGSGNFSGNGLTRSYEAGVYCDVSDDSGDFEFFQQGLLAADGLWADATPVENVIDRYEQGWRAAFARRPDGELNNQIPGARTVFWIEAGYVTRNRGPNRPGNQIDLPRGMSNYFGIFPEANTPINTALGEIAFRTPNNMRVERNIRLGNNSMEKITLPIPENHGYDLYDGKILVFRSEDGEFHLSALEVNDFEAAYGDRLGPVMAMGSGRLYGHIEE